MPEENPSLYPKEASGRNKITSEELLQRTVNKYREITGKWLSGLLRNRIETIYNLLEKMDPTPLPCRTIAQLVRNKKSFRVKETSERCSVSSDDKHYRIHSRRLYNKGLNKNTTHKSVKICLSICEITGTIKRINFDDETVYLLSYEPIKKVIDAKEVKKLKNDFNLMETGLVTFLHRLQDIKKQLSSSP